MLEIYERCHGKQQIVQCATAVNSSKRNQLCSFHVGVSKETENEKQKISALQEPLACIALYCLKPSESKRI